MRDAKIERIDVRAYQIPTDYPEADGTLAWDSTIMVLVIARAGEQSGLGYSYTDASAAQLIETKLKDVALGTGALAPPAAWQAMVGAVRNFGAKGLAASAIAAVDVALWDLKARLLDLPLASLLGPIATPFRSTAAAVSHPTRSIVCRRSSPAGSSRASAWSR